MERLVALANGRSQHLLGSDPFFNRGVGTGELGSPLLFSLTERDLTFDVPERILAFRIQPRLMSVLQLFIDFGNLLERVAPGLRHDLRAFAQTSGVHLL